MSTWLGPPCMNRKITRFARAAWYVTDPAATGPAADAAAARSADIPANAVAPNPPAAVRSRSRREAAR